MTSWVEFEGKSVAKAVAKASAELHISSDDLDYEVISHGSTGIFGLAGVKKARIRVRLPDSEPVAEKPEAPAGENEGGLEDESRTRETFSPEDPGETPVLFSFPEDPRDLGRSVLQRIVDTIVSDAAISVEESDGQLFFNVESSDAAVLIGKKGQTLEAIQSLVEKIVNRRNHHERIRIHVDVGGYLETRRANLEKLAERLAEKSLRIGKPISLGQMSPYDRRVIHLALKDHPAVKTRSRGEGSRRKLVIFPRRDGTRSGQAAT